MLTKGDKFLILTIILISFILLRYFSRDLLRYDKKVLKINIDGEEFKTINLDKNIRNKEVKVASKFGYNLIRIDGEEVRVIEASCPDKLDISQGKVSKVGDIIVCLPNRLTLEIVGYDDDLEIDKLSR